MNSCKAILDGRSASTHENGFTRLELMAIIAIVVLLAMIQLPVLAGARVKSHHAVCLANFSNLIRAWQLYASDNSGRLAGNVFGGDAQNPTSNNPYSAWTVGWLDWGTSIHNTNKLYLTDSRYSKLASYLNHESKVFKCPADTYLSRAQRLRGWSERVRSYSSNIGIGDGNAETGPWDPIYKHVRRISEFVYPGPAETFVYLDEHPDSINDPGFFNPRVSSWIDQPAAYHNGAANLAFADGHAETHRWAGSLGTERARAVKLNNGIDAPASMGDPDIKWVSYRGCRTSERSY